MQNEKNIKLYFWFIFAGSFPYFVLRTYLNYKENESIIGLNNVIILGAVILGFIGLIVMKIKTGSFFLKKKNN